MGLALDPMIAAGAMASGGNHVDISIERRDEPRKEDAMTTMFRDPVCGMEVDPETAAARAEHEGKTYYFCSKSCEEKFKAEPEKYAG